MRTPRKNTTKTTTTTATTANTEVETVIKAIKQQAIKRIARGRSVMASNEQYQIPAEKSKLSVRQMRNRTRTQSQSQSQSEPQTQQQQQQLQALMIASASSTELRSSKSSPLLAADTADCDSIYRWRWRDWRWRGRDHFRRYRHRNRHLSLAEIAAALAAIVYLFATICVLPVANGLGNCPIGCTCDDDALVVKCSEGALDVLPITLNPFTQRLVITNNKKIRTIDSSITFYAELTFLDLSFNELVNIPAQAFVNQKKLRELHLSHNKIGQVNNETFVGLALLTVLNLRGNLIAELGYKTFSTAAKVEELNLGENRISSIDPHAFDGLVNLRVLYLDDNTLTTVPAAVTFAAVPNLAELFLGTNSFESLPSGVFEHIKGLTRLDLRGAGLVHNISIDALKGLEGLRYLDLSDNRLAQVPTTALGHLHRLEELSLGQNDFEIIIPDAFSGLKNLRRLEISGAQRLQRITSGAFAENTNLEYLNFSGNKMLSIIEENALRGLPHLRHVILRENQLSTLAEGLFPWNDLATLDLTDNPFVCDCHVVWLRNLLASSNVTSNASFDGSPVTQNHVANIICIFPEHFHGKSLVQLSPTELGCSHITSSNQALISLLIVGVTVIISALVFIIYGCRQRIRDTLKGGWGNSALGRKEREYQKTFSDEEYMTRQQHPCLGLGVHPTIASAPYASEHHAGNYNAHNHAYMGSRPIPVTEL